MTATPAPRVAPRSRRGAPLAAARPRWGERLGVAALLGCALVSVATTVGIVVALVEPTRRFFAEVSPAEFFGGRDWAPLFEPPSFGVAPLLAGTLLTTACALVVCLPFGLGTAVYLSEYAGARVRGVLKPTLELLAGIPTVVYGFFALTFVSPLLERVWPLGRPPGVFSALSAGLVMGVMILPTVASLSEDAMAAVPRSLREGAAALGASRPRATMRVVLPAALSGIVASFVLGVSRAVGETMIVLVAAGGTPNLTLNPVDAVLTMTAFVASTGIGDVATGTTAYRTIFAVAGTLFALTFALNAVSVRLARRFREVYE